MARAAVAARHRFLEMVRRLAREGTTIVLITHHVEEIIPEIDRVFLLQRGRVVDSGDKATMLTDEPLTTLFGAPVTVGEDREYYHARA